VVYTRVLNLRNVEPEGFVAEAYAPNVKVVAGRDVAWHAEHLKFASRERSDVIVLPWNIGHISLIPTMLKARWNGVGTVLWGHGVSKAENLLRRTARWRVSRLADSVMFYNNLAAGKFLEFEHIRDRVFIAQNALDQTSIQQARSHWLRRPEELSAFSKQKGLGDPVLIFVSRLLESNRADVLLRATAIIKKACPAVTTIIIGEGPAEGSLRALASELGISDNVLFVGPIYDELALAPYFLSADLFVYPTNLGLSILHAFGYGVPVVTGDLLHAHNPEIEALENGHNGLLFRHLDPRDLAARVLEFVQQPSRLVAMSMRAHETVMQRFTVTRMVDGIEAAVRHAAQNANR
jgi:glycosyltransferase involved in cell wall biosynthesis